jgi:branched-chain amino acid aminotransferase
MTASNRRIFKLDEHIARLYRSAHTICLAIPMNSEALKEAIVETLRRNDRAEAYIRVVVSRGPGFPLLDPRYVYGSTVLIMVHDTRPPAEFAKHLSRAYKLEGLKVAIVSTRKTPPVCMESRIKSTNYLNNIMARLQAVAAGADEAMMLDIQGFLAEGAAENFFLVRDSRLYTPFAHNTLAGITREILIELAKDMGVPTVESNLTPYDLYNADEAFCSSSFGSVVPIRDVDGRVIGQECPGPISRRLGAAYQNLIDREGTPY